MRVVVSGSTWEEEPTAVTNEDNVVADDTSITNDSFGEINSTGDTVVSDDTNEDSTGDTAVSDDTNE